MRESCISLLYDHVRPRMTLAQYSDTLTWWEIEPIIAGGELTGCALALRDQIHIAVKPEHQGRWARREMVARFLAGRIAEYGPIKAWMFKDNPKALRFVERLGFKRVEDNETQILFQLDIPSIPGR